MMGHTVPVKPLERGTLHRTPGMTRLAGPKRDLSQSFLLYDNSRM